MKVLNFVGGTQRALCLMALVTLACAETLLVSTLTRALELRSNNVTSSRQELYAVGSYRCADRQGKNVVRIRLTKKEGELYNLNLNLFGNVFDHEVSETMKEGDGQAYTAYDPKSNATYKLIEYPNERAKFIYSLEGSNGEAQASTVQNCIKLG